jgi:heme-degrading monooxygenase HmoA
MYIRITWCRVAEGRWAEFRRIYSKYVETRVDAQRGMLHRYVARMTGEDEGFIVSIWASEEDLLAYADHPVHQEILQHVDSDLIVESWVKHGQVSAG